MSWRRRHFASLAVGAAYGAALGSYGIGLWVLPAVIPGGVVIALVFMAPEVGAHLRTRKLLADYVFDPADFIEVDRPGGEEEPRG